MADGGTRKFVRHGTLQPRVDALDQTSSDDAVAICERLLGGHANDGWDGSRTRRLKQYLDQL